MPAESKPTEAAFLLLARGPRGTSQVAVRGTRILILGRTGGSADLQFNDSQISRLHAEVSLAPGGRGLLIRRLPDSLNRVFMLGGDGQFHNQGYDSFLVEPGRTFAIGSTYFTVQANRPVEHDPLPSIHVSFSPDTLRQARMPDAEGRLQAALGLPAVLGRATSEEALQRAALEVLRANLPEAGLVAIVEADEATPPSVVVVQREEAPELGLPPISARLVAEALHTGQTVLFHWDTAGATPPGGTMVSEPTWAACLALGHRRRCLYMGGRNLDAPLGTATQGRGQRWQGDLKFLELVGSLLGSLLSARDLQARHALLHRFLPPQVLAWLETMSPADQWRALSPRSVELTVMFCDLAGFSRLAERFVRTPLRFWKVVQDALGIMTQTVREQDGIVVDFQGDSVLAIWGWPETTTGAESAAEAAQRGAQAALLIQQRFPDVQASFQELWLEHLDARETGSDPPSLRCGVALTTGSALVGYLGTAEMGGVDVFGHTVNRASRLERLTRHFHVPIVIDEPTVQRLGRRCPSWCRIDPLMRVQLAGMAQETALISQLSPADAPEPALPSDEERQLFESGRWPELWPRLRPSEQGFRLFMRELLEDHAGRPPEGWNGVYVQTK